MYKIKPVVEAGCSSGKTMQFRHVFRQLPLRRYGSWEVWLLIFACENLIVIFDSVVCARLLDRTSSSRSLELVLCVPFPVERFPLR